ncbi:MAG: protein-methionine-sulfoxide reductase heme-binding subunit MsrQ [Terracidiphilus sp.]|jgi:sulfoxide reductase heme-binding subunit YedZ
MKRPTLILLKTLTWLTCLWPLGRLVWGAATSDLGADPTATITFATGLATLRILTISLSITPLRRLSPRLSWLIKFRRLLGLFAFFYASLHLMTYVALYAGFDVNAMAADIAKRRYITAGVAAWLLLLPLAATSTNWAIRKLGGKRWNRLHKLVYAAAVCGVIHYWWQVKPGVLTPLTITVILGVLLLSRPAWTLQQRWLRSRKAAAPRPAG